MAHPHNLSTQEPKAGGPRRIQGQPDLQSEFSAILNYIMKTSVRKGHTKIYIHYQSTISICILHLR